MNDFVFSGSKPMKYYLMKLFVLPYKPVTWWMYDYTSFKSSWMILLKIKFTAL